jgi:pimeloyl-ACP methyl ester carboxylesterase
VERLLHVETEDGLALAGALVAPDGEGKSLVVVWIHGNTGVFHEYPYVLAARGLAARGYPVLLGNTRGYGVTNGVWSVREDRPLAGGSAWELLEEAPSDVAAWTEEAARHGERVAVLGHSQGAAKVVLHAAERRDDRVAGVVLASPDLHGHWWEVVADAERLVDDGRGEELLPALMGESWYRLSAANVASRARVLAHVYASDSRTPSVAGVRQPLLAFFAATDVGGAAELDAIRANARAAASVETTILDGGDHVYTDAEDDAAELIAGWLDGIS